MTPSHHVWYDAPDPYQLPELQLPPEHRGRPLTDAALKDMHSRLLFAVPWAAKAYADTPTNTLHNMLRVIDFDFATQRNAGVWFIRTVLSAVFLQRDPEPVQPARGVKK